MRSDCTIRQVRAVYKCPCPDVPGSVYIGVAPVTAGATPKLILTRSIQFFRVPTGRTGAASIARVNSDHRNTGKFSLVIDKQTELRERPRVLSLFPVGQQPQLKGELHSNGVYHSTIKAGAYSCAPAIPLPPKDGSFSQEGTL